ANKALEAVSTPTATYSDFKWRFRRFQKSNNPLRVIYAEVHFLPTIFDWCGEDIRTKTGEVADFWRGCEYVQILDSRIDDDVRL
ncbi:MAG: hypothetical protein Q9175_004687, partial [Cornicularia normoerica]